MKREKSIFTNSRLYPQSYEAHESFLKYLLLTVEKPYRFLFKKNEDKIIIEDIQCMNDIIDKIDKKCARISLELESYSTIPKLIEILSKYYYTTDYSNFDLPYLGIGAKSALCYLYGNISTGTGSANSKVFQFIEYCMLKESLIGLKNLIIIHPEEVIELTCYGALLSDRLRVIAIDLSSVNKSEHRGLRLGKYGADLFLNKHSDFLRSVINVINTRNNSIPDIFKKTPFEYIPFHVETKDFWIKSYLYLKLLVFIASVRKSIEDSDYIGVVILNDCAMILNELNIPLIEKDLQRLNMTFFWQRPWFKKRIGNWNSNMINERPIVRIDNNSKGLYATSVTIVCDSFNWFLESSVLNYSEKSAGVNLPQGIFQNAVSNKFEEDVISFLKEHDFRAGKVSENATWFVETPTKLTNINNEKIPGEIDCLAVKNGTVLLIECKVLTDGVDENKIRNLSSKLNEDDQELFFYKQESKFNWLMNTVEFRNNYDFIKIILLDKKHLARVSDTHIVLTFDELKEMVS
ncbi:hypothetical protein [Kosakonia oryzae]|uniref:Uncharacterized protein n=1 Tax=Kosakonia oryzae TaxID=497725 RepID=A0AA94H1N2_9ENTR|nr:hypothetical protein [Kosakonia oryzae]ANI83275.1 hypothetical protein AWR26_14335 [Kosakonia oryzae]SFC04006.1 hypothetical protein SAMN05216286_1388 [Kosakonia oryzae]